MQMARLMIAAAVMRSFSHRAWRAMMRSFSQRGDDALVACVRDEVTTVHCLLLPPTQHEHAAHRAAHRTSHSSETSGIGLRHVPRTP